MHEKLVLFNSLLINKNQETNLTAHKTEAQSLKYNIEDSLLFAPTIEKYIKHMPHPIKTVDIGSGGGCPAVPLKISFPTLDITMIDSVRKKTDFLTQVINELGLEHIRATHTRIEDFCTAKRESFHIVTARAVAPLCTLLEYTLPLLCIGGILFAYKGQGAGQELSNARNALKTLGGMLVEVIDAPLDHEITRTMLVIKKVSKTPTQFPRGKNLPRLKPL